MGDSDSSSDDDSDSSNGDTKQKKKKKVEKQNFYNKKKWKKKLKALEKTKTTMDVKNVEKYLLDSQKEHQKITKSIVKKNKQMMKEQEKKAKQQKKKEQDLKNYVGMDSMNMTSNQNMTADYEDNF